MYKSLELYPKASKGKKEFIYLTSHAAGNIELFFEHVIYKQRMSARKCASMLGLSAGLLCLFKQKVLSPSIDVYLNMMKFAGISLSNKDVNFAYANISYPPEVIKHHINRLNIPVSKTIWKRKEAAAIATLLKGRDLRDIHATINYGVRRSCSLYGELMLCLMREERRRALPNLLRFLYLVR